ncbi:hypothetical protein ASD53_18010 [Lysobacter sp. Root559]|uniref:hypothetical protein n=1 Tax=Lysobacter sp. Root559 TaxID=1736559 RepID=UPI0006F1E501|nr:hypothetical protein [Lysobacter sp. Root559]KQZ65531.1 hypothetical protein ASD53_18010 [Lysobacter sp. Root559]
MNNRAPTTISQRIDALVEQMPELVADNVDEADFWATYVRLSGPIIRDAAAIGDEALEQASLRLEDVLAQYGKLGPAIPKPSDPKTVPLGEWLRQTRKTARKRAF